MPVKNIHSAANSPLGNLPISNPLPELPEGPSLERVRAPIEIMQLGTWQITLLVTVTVIILGLLLSLFFWRSRKNTLKNVESDCYEESLQVLNAINPDTISSQLAADLLDVMYLFLKRSYKITISDGSHETIIRQLKIADSQTQKIHNFWEICNRAKFSQESLDLKARRELIDMAEEIIGELQSSLREELK